MFMSVMNVYKQLIYKQTYFVNLYFHSIYLNSKNETVKKYLQVFLYFVIVYFILALVGLNKQSVGIVKVQREFMQYYCCLQLGGVTVFVIGVWTLVDKSFINELLGTNLFMGAVYILITTGALVALVSFFGCLGAIKEIKCMLLTVTNNIDSSYFILIY